MSDSKYWNISAKGIAFDPTTGESFQLNQSGHFMLILAQQGLGAEAIAMKVSKTFNISYERSITDVLEFLVHLESMSKTE
jgi:hypothetical protein